MVYNSSIQIILWHHTVIITYPKLFWNIVRNRMVHTVIIVLELHMDHIT